MSLVTRCPACDTTFKVVRDQLRISDGWVRCGRCSQVFDGAAYLQELPDSEEARAAPQAPERPPEQVSPIDEAPVPIASATPSEDASAPDHFSEDFLDDDHDQVEHVARADPESKPEPEPEPEPEPRTSSEFESEASAIADPPIAPARMPWPDADTLLLGNEGGRTVPRPPAPAPLSFPDIDLNLRASRPAAWVGGAESEPVAGAEDSGYTPLEKALRRARVKSAKIAKANKARALKLAAAAADAGPAPVVHAASESEPESRADAAADAAVPAFSHFGGGGEGSSDSPSFWSRAGVRRTVLLACVLAAVLLAVQVLHQQRDLIAARQPALRPLLDGLCRVTGCEVSGLRQIADIKIDGASFARDRSGDGFQLSFTLRNAAAVPLAMPAVELTLLDTQERAVVRRVLMPADFGAPAMLPARGERAASLSLNLSGAEAALMPPVAGFNLVALYP